MKLKLTTLRAKLDVLSESYFTFLKERKNLVAEINSVKQKSELSSWDPKREFEIFQKFFSELVALTELELLSYSLIIESHTRSINSNYPAWALGVHLEQNRSGSKNLLDIWCQMNPILVFVCARSQFEQLPIKSEFLTKILGQIDV